jgi:sigma-E factor negative regulatory protein RseC
MAKGSCSVAEMEEKIVEVEHYQGSPLKPGHPVTLAMKRSSGNRAILFGYFIPFLVVLTVLIAGSFFTSHEGLLGLLALGSLVPYYLVLYLKRDKLKKGFAISIEG